MRVDNRSENFPLDVIISLALVIRMHMMPLPKMPHPMIKRNNIKRGDTRFPGICRHAKALGVSRSSLYRVLTGEWKHLTKLRARYDALLKSESKS
jgi:hypothetical protein